MEQLLPLIQEVGFPVVVTLYLLHRIEGKLDTLNNTLNRLPERMQQVENIPYNDQKTV
ncbi:YvrJ family protein [Bacillus marinisedimentorum]|uniref:YvrJ family protein n=1 Tax=Bacillus marinisedimentorum TaxID=1821260 RepID=UPI0009F3873F|nr:YvrJ family protein [Bacillus marinisedimentorum]